MGDVIIQKLDAAGQDQVSRFRMEDAEDRPLEIFIRRDARKSAAAHLTQTYVAKLTDSNKVIGYVSMMCAEIKLAQSYSIHDKPGADKFEYQPAVRIARLAVGNGWRRHELRFGPRLLSAAIGIILGNIQPHAGCRFIVLDAKKKSINFYERNGFRLLDTPTNREADSPLMFLDLKPAA
jgi:ribosomal protein S18 acetylase RimI-like enzyme